MATALSLAAQSAWSADTGPEYLEQAEEQHPISSGFMLLQLPFERRRLNTLNARTFYMDRTIDGADDRQNWAGGGWLNVVGSYFDESVKFAGTVYTSQKLWADDDKAETGALQPTHNSYTQLGEIYASYTLDKLALQAGRYAFDLPYVNTHDIRMTPQTFQAAHAVYGLTDEWIMGGGVLTHIKQRTREGFDAVYEVAGLEENEDPILLTSIYETEPGSLAGIYFMHAPDYMNGVYLEASKRFWLEEDRYVQLSGQYTHQESTGDELDGDFSVDHYGARITWQDGWYSGSLAWTDYPEEDELRSPWGGIPGYTSVMISNFDRPEESAWLFGGTVDFDGLGSRGLSVNAKAVIGDTPDCGVNASPDRDEYNLNFNYRPDNFLKGLFVQLRFAWIKFDDTCDNESGEDVAEVRLVTNYAFEF